MLDKNKIYNEDCLGGLKKIDDGCVDVLVSDPPYGISFLGKDWDKSLPSIDVWKECYRVMRPGAFAFIMSSARQDVLYRMIQNLESTGFQTNFTSIYWAYKTGMPHFTDISTAVDNKLGIERPRNVPFQASSKLHGTSKQKEKAKSKEGYFVQSKDPISLEAKNLSGSYAGFQPKPSLEIIIVAMTPLAEKTYVDQALSNNKGVTWLDQAKIRDNADGKLKFPSNLLVGGECIGTHSSQYSLDSWFEEKFGKIPQKEISSYPFIFIPKPDLKEKREGIDESLGIMSDEEWHPTVKPIQLMSFLIALGSMHGDTVLDPYMGSGTTAVASVITGREFIGFELSDKYADIGNKRVEYMRNRYGVLYSHNQKEHILESANKKDPGLFGEDV